MIPEHTLYLETSNMGGCYYYCKKSTCSGLKGYPIHNELRKFDTLDNMLFSIQQTETNNYKSYHTMRSENESLNTLIWAIR